MATAAPPAQAGPALAAQSPEQLRAALWASGALQVYAVVMGSRIEGLPARLAQADVVDHDCLLPGALSPAEQAAAPYLVQLRPGGEFTQWLLFEAAAGFGDWGLLLRSPLPFLALRAQARALCEARTADGQAIRLDWMDPVLLRALLPLAPPDQLDQLFAGIDTLVLPGAQQWTHLSAAYGQLQQRAVGVLGRA